MHRQEEDKAFEQAYGLRRPEGPASPAKLIFFTLAGLAAAAWFYDLGPFAPSVEFDFDSHARQLETNVAVDAGERHWTLASAPSVTAAFRVYGSAYMEAGERPPDSPWSLVSHIFLIEPLKVNQAKIATAGHEAEDHSTWLQFAARAANNAVLQDIENLSPVGSRLCAEITARRFKLLGFHDDALGQNQQEWTYSCDSNHRCDNESILVIDAIRAIDCNSGS